MTENVPEFVPTEEEIKEACKRIRAEWSVHETKRRRVIGSKEWEVPEVKRPR